MLKSWHNLKVEKRRKKLADRLSETITTIERELDALIKLNELMEEFAIDMAKLGCDELVDDLTNYIASNKMVVENSEFFVHNLRESYMTGEAISNFSDFRERIRILVQLSEHVQGYRKTAEKAFDFYKTSKDFVVSMYARRQ